MQDTEDNGCVMGICRFDKRLIDLRANPRRCSHDLSDCLDLRLKRRRHDLCCATSRACNDHIFVLEVDLTLPASGVGDRSVWYALRILMARIFFGWKCCMLRQGGQVSLKEDLASGEALKVPVKVLVTWSCDIDPVVVSCLSKDPYEGCYILFIVMLKGQSRPHN